MRQSKNSLEIIILRGLLLSNKRSDRILGVRMEIRLNVAD